MASSATGTFTHCGPGQPFALDFTCTGPSCSALTGFPNTTCTTGGDSVLSCTNSVTCTGPTNYTSEFSFSQKDVIVSQKQKVTVDCGEFELSSDGTTGGTKFKVLDTKECASGSSNGTTDGHSSSLPSSSPTSHLNGTTAVSVTGSKSSSIFASNGFPAPYANGTATAPTTIPGLNGHPGSYSDETANTKVEHAESTIYSTKEVTITSCRPTVTNCPAHVETLVSVINPGGSVPVSSAPVSAAPVSGSVPASTSVVLEGSTIGPEPSVPVIPSHGASYLHETPVVSAPETSGRYFSAPSESVGSQLNEIPTGSVQGPGNAYSSIPGGPPVPYSDEPATAPSPSPFLGVSTPVAPSTYQNGTATAFISTPSDEKPLTFTGGASSRRVARPAVLCILLFVISFLVQNTAALSYPDKAVAPILVDRSLSMNMDQPGTTYGELQSRELNKFFKTFADLFSEYLANKLTAAGGKGDLFADNLVAEVEEAVCDHFVNGAISAVALGTLLEDCVAAVYAGNLLVAPELEFLSVFGAGLLCNYAINELFPGIGELTDAVCKDKKTCGNLLTDPKNCGACGNVVCISQSL